MTAGDAPRRSAWSFRGTQQHHPACAPKRDENPYAHGPEAVFIVAKKVEAAQLSTH